MGKDTLTIEDIDEKAHNLKQIDIAGTVNGGLSLLNISQIASPDNEHDVLREAILDENDDEDDDDDDDDDEDDDEESKLDVAGILSKLQGEVKRDNLKKLKVTELRELVVTKELVGKGKAKNLNKNQLLKLFN